MSEGRKTRRAGPKDEKAKLDRDWQKISKVRINESVLSSNCLFSLVCFVVMFHQKKKGKCFSIKTNLRSPGDYMYFAAVYLFSGDSHAANLAPCKNHTHCSFFSFLVINSCSYLTHFIRNAEVILAFDCMDNFEHYRLV